MTPVSINRVKRIKEQVKSVVGSSGFEIPILKDTYSLEIARECSCSVHDVHMESLKLGIIPYRYIRNAKSITIEEQLKLAESRVTVVGAGGLGGQALILLARLGIGYLTVVDHDVFDETNLNRQAFSNSATIGRPKVEVAVEALYNINPGVETKSHPVKINESNAVELLEGSDVIVDGLDNIADRFVLEAAAKKLGIPLVYAAIAGFEGQVMTIFPGDKGLEAIYSRENKDKKKRGAPESVLGIPALTPAVIASYQVMEVLKIILKTGSVKQNRMFYIEMETGQTHEFFLDDNHEQS